MFAKLLVALWLLGALGCGPNLKAISAGHVGCPPDQVEISALQKGAGWTWAATCQGRRFRCSGYGYTTQCTPETSGSGGVVAASGANFPVTAPTVNRSIQPNGAVRFDVTIALAEHARLAVSVLPISSPNETLVTLEYPNQLDGPRCQLQLMVNGQLTPIQPQGFLQAGQAGQWTFLAETAAIRAAANTGHLVGRVCGHEFRLDPSSQQGLVALMRRYDEERAFAGANQAGASTPPDPPENGPTTPTDGTPNWEGGSAPPAQ